MGNLLASSNFVQLEQIAVRIVEKEDMPVAFSGETHWRGYHLHAGCLEPFIRRRHIFDPKTEVRAGHMMDRMPSFRALGMNPLDQIESPVRKCACDR